MYCCGYCFTPDAEDKKKPRKVSWWRRLLGYPCYAVVCRGCGAQLAWRYTDGKNNNISGS